MKHKVIAATYNSMTVVPIVDGKELSEDHAIFVRLQANHPRKDGLMPIRPGMRIELEGE